MSTDITVKLVNNKNTVLKEATFKTVSGKLPIKEIGRHFQVKNLIWSDIDTPIATDPKNENLSEMTFVGMKTLNVTGTAL
ncbi:hypothetical protein DLAC_00385 [Tieghemostelium lacteum]|uniref:Uncharacterized protein n=1 Tax=Tieghemostelium lacteum TaxID=361077 RepID=A0A152A9U2_TIELA|nr:hypothetical protein DLAC_00385 [Tieghemostelium lacteum]|eukprot:KYR02905.1 hypothetical protein DLAC_00385 [Tieghemostelium lacteum]